MPHLGLRLFAYTVRRFTYTLSRLRPWIFMPIRLKQERNGLTCQTRVVDVCRLKSQAHLANMADIVKALFDGSGMAA